MKGGEVLGAHATLIQTVYPPCQPALRPASATCSIRAGSFTSGGAEAISSRWELPRKAAAVFSAMTRIRRHDPGDELPVKGADGALQHGLPGMILGPAPWNRPTVTTAGFSAEISSGQPQQER